MNYKKITIDTYNKSANDLAAYFAGIGPRISDIERALKLAGAPTKPLVVEIGCGDGRDAQEIIKRVDWYEGFDPSEELLKIARQKVPKGNFKFADAMSYEYPKNLDVVFAFASLLHVNKDDFAIVCEKVSQALRKDGIFYISVKERDTYQQDIKKDIYGERLFYFYTTQLIKELSEKWFTVAYEDHQDHAQSRWITLALKRL